MVRRRAKRRRAGGPSYEEVKAQINAREQERLKKTGSKNRIESIIPKLNATADQEDQMLMIMEALNDTVAPIPEPGMTCTFVYNAKTPGLTYDQHPLVLVTDLFSWGFRGMNFHWRKYRQYTWNELPDQVYIVLPEELDDLLSVQYATFVLNR